MDSMDSIDWLQQQDLQLWKARIRQLRLELSEERTQQQLPRSVPQEAASPSHQGDRRNQFALSEAATALSDLWPKHGFSYRKYHLCLMCAHVSHYLNAINNSI